MIRIEESQENFNEKIEKTLNLFGLPVEIRIPTNGRNGTVSGYFDNTKDAITALDNLLFDAESVYMTLNRFPEQCCGRSYNQFAYRSRFATADSDVTRRLWLLIDCDSKKPVGTSATDEQHAWSHAKAKQIRADLAKLGFPDPVYADSGNGAHLLYRIDLQNDETSKQLIKSFLEILAKRYDDEHVAIDKSVFNAGRVTKLYGTKVRKGHETGGARHRASLLIDVPEPLNIVTAESITAAIIEIESYLANENDDESEVVKQAKAAASQSKPKHKPNKEWDMQAFFDKHKIETRSGPTEYRGGQKWVLRSCPLCGSEDKAAMVSLIDGIPGYKCQHNRCSGKKWQDFRKHYEPEYDPDRKYTEKPEADKSTKGPSLPSQLVNFALENCDLWQSKGTGFVTLRRGDRLENCSLTDEVFSNYLSAEFYKTKGISVSKTAKAEAIETLKGLATETEQHETYIRVARVNNTIYLDLGTPSWEAVEITANGWKVVKNPPVKFRRSQCIGALPIPTRGGNIDALRKLLPLDQDNFTLCLAWLLDTLRGATPCFALNLIGEASAGKTTLTSILQTMVCPGASIHSAKGQVKHDIRDFVTEAWNSWVLCFDNVSKLSKEQSDWLCKLITGAEWRCRKLYADEAIVVMYFARPVILNGINEFITQPDLMSRCLPIELSALREDQKRPEEELYAEVKAMHPAALGALLDACSYGLANPEKVANKGRLADSYLWAARCLPYFGISREQWELAFTNAQKQAHEHLVETSALGKAVVGYLSSNGSGTKTAAEWLTTYRQWFGTDTQAQYLPKDATRLSTALTNLIPSLTALGIEIIIKRTYKARLITIGWKKDPNHDASDDADDAEKSQRHGQRHGLSPDIPTGYENHDANDASFTLFRQKRKREEEQDDKRDSRENHDSSVISVMTTPKSLYDKDLNHDANHDARKTSASLASCSASSASPNPQKRSAADWHTASPELRAASQVKVYAWTRPEVFDEPIID